MANNSFLSNIWLLAVKEFQLEWRQKVLLTSALIYVIGTVFICYLSFVQITDVPTWNALFWIILVFGNINIVTRSFLKESEGLQLYYYTLLPPAGVILSKILYNFIMMLILSMISLFMYILFLGNLVGDLPMFLIGLVLGNFGLSSILTLVSAIASKSGGNPSLMAVLSFPVLLPLLKAIIRFSKNAIDDLGWVVNGTYAITLAGLGIIVLVLSYLLFPYLWKE